MLDQKPLIKICRTPATIQSNNKTTMKHNVAIISAEICFSVLGGGRKVCVFSTRTQNRSNPIGFSLEEWDHATIICHCVLRDLIIVDGPAIFDMMPYVPYYDCVAYTPTRRMNDFTNIVAHDGLIDMGQSSEPSSRENTINIAVKRRI